MSGVDAIAKRATRARKVQSRSDKQGDKLHKELDLRIKGLLGRLTEAANAKDSNELVWINTELITLYHLYGQASPLPAAVQKAFVDTVKPAAAVVPQVDDKDLLRAALADARKITQDKNL